MEFTKNNAIVDIFAIECGMINFEYCACIRAVVRDDKTNEIYEEFKAVFGECGEWNSVNKLRSIDAWYILESKELKGRLMKIIEAYKAFNPEFETVKF